MTQPNDRFHADLSALDDVAKNDLPQVVAEIRAQIPVITAHEGIHGPGSFAEVFSVGAAYVRYTDIIGTRLTLGANRLEETAEALADIVALYRKADGQ